MAGSSPGPAAIQVSLRGKDNVTYSGTIVLSNLSSLFNGMFNNQLPESNHGNQHEHGQSGIPGHPRDAEGARYYVIAVILVYGMSIVMLIASHIKRKHAKLIEDRQIHKYLQEFQIVKEKSSRDSYKHLKKSIMMKLSMERKHTYKNLSHAMLPVIAVGLPPVDDDDEDPESGSSRSGRRRSIMRRFSLFSSFSRGSISSQGRYSSRDSISFHRADTSLSQIPTDGCSVQSGGSKPGKYLTVPDALYAQSGPGEPGPRRGSLDRRGYFGGTSLVNDTIPERDRERDTPEVIDGTDDRRPVWPEIRISDACHQYSERRQVPAERSRGFDRSRRQTVHCPRMASRDWGQKSPRLTRLESPPKQHLNSLTRSQEGIGTVSQPPAMTGGRPGQLSLPVPQPWGTPGQLGCQFGRRAITPERLPLPTVAEAHNQRHPNLNLAPEALLPRRPEEALPGAELPASVIEGRINGDVAGGERSPLTRARPNISAGSPDAGIKLSDMQEDLDPNVSSPIKGHPPSRGFDFAASPLRQDSVPGVASLSSRDSPSDWIAYSMEDVDDTVESTTDDALDSASSCSDSSRDSGDVWLVMKPHGSPASFHSTPGASDQQLDPHVGGRSHMGSCSPLLPPAGLSPRQERLISDASSTKSRLSKASVDSRPGSPSPADPDDEGSQDTPFQITCV